MLAAFGERRGRRARRLTRLRRSQRAATHSELAPGCLGSGAEIVAVLTCFIVQNEPEPPLLSP
jgi:hypothetical protein